MKKWAWVKQFVATWERLRVTNGNLYAGAITYFSFLALFPLLLLAVSVLGFVLHAHPDTLQTLFTKISSNAPGQVGQTLNAAIKSAINARTTIGLVGLAGVILAGLGWIANLRLSVDAIWKLPLKKQNPITQRIANLGVLALLGAALLVSLGITAAWAAFAHEILSALGLDNVPGMGTLLGSGAIRLDMIDLSAEEESELCRRLALGRGLARSARRHGPACHTWPSREGPWSGSPTGCTGCGAAQIRATYRCARLGYNLTRPRRPGSALIDPRRRWSHTPAPQCSTTSAICGPTPTNSRCRSVAKHGVPTYVYTADGCPTKTGSSCMACRPPAPGE